MTATIRRILPLPVLLFNLILGLIAIVDLVNGYAAGSYIEATYLLCITSFLAVVTISVISFLNFRQPDWIHHSLAFELVWVSLLLVFQFISSTVISAESVNDLCRSGTYVNPAKGRTYNICPTHKATMAFDWASFILLATHLIIFLFHLRSLQNLTNPPTAFSTLLFEPTPTSNEADVEKNIYFPRRAHSPSGSSDSTGHRKNRPPPLDLSGVTNANLPIYQSFAKAGTINGTDGDRSGRDQRRRTQSAPNRHQVMAEYSSQQDTSNNPYGNRHLANAKIHPDWAAPSEWRIEPSEPSIYSNSTVSLASTHQPHAHTSRSNLKGLKPLHLVAKQLPVLPRGGSSTSLPEPGRAITHDSVFGQHAGGESVVNRPDPRNRKPVRLDELAAEGGFWLNRTSEERY
ncbi:hypothetical protein FRB99_001301 [Tulasnella sp. 403]|nr:hypothetical protein FRB99_001301 [Tulasnella sp. 403]